MAVDRQAVFNKFNGLCGYSGTTLEDDWQVDHIFPKHFMHWLKSSRMCEIYNINITDINHIDNLIPAQRIINHYKGGLFLNELRGIGSYGLQSLHTRIAKLPKNPKTEKSITRKRNMFKLASYFNITPENNPFDGWFYFEKLMLSEWF